MLAKIGLLSYYFRMISVCILTKNAAKTLKKTLDSTQLFDEVILFDNGSTDETLEMAKSYPNVKTISHPFIGFGPMRNKAAQFAKNDWILALDSDEVLSPALVREIQALQLNEKWAYQIPRHNYYNGKQMKACGWGSEILARLYQRKVHQYSEDQVHEKLLSKNHKKLSSPLIHTPYRTTEEFLAKMQHYSTLFAKQNKGKKSSFSKALLHGMFAFLKSYFFKRGIFYGKEGLIISIYNANTAFYKYLKLLEINR